MEESLALGMGRFISGLSYDDVPKEVVHRIKTAVLDVIGNACGGFIRDVPRLAVDALAKTYGTASGESTVWHTPYRLSAPIAATACATLICGADYSYGPVAEIGAGAIPPAMALGEQLQVDGRRLLVALVAGHEILFRYIGITSSQRLQSQKFYHSGVQNPPGAAASAAKILQLGEDASARAVGLANALVAGSMVMFEEGAGESKYYYVGRTAGVGVTCAILAQNGYPCTSHMVEHFYVQTFGDPEQDPRKWFASLGSDFLTRFVRFKLNPACLHTHTSIEGAYQAVNQNGLVPESVRSLLVEVSTITEELVGSWRPVNRIVEAQYSIPFLVSFVLTRRRRPRVEDFNQETINDPQIRLLMQRITVVRSGEADAAEGYGATPPFRNLCRMKFEFESGSPLEIFVERPRGTYPDLPSDDVIFEKFHDQAELLYSRDHADRIIDVVMNLDRLDNVSKLTSLLFRSTAM